MEILQACIRFPPAPGGAETHVHSISKELLKRGHSVQVYTSDLYKEIPFTKMADPAPTVDSIPVKRLGSYSLGNELHYVFIPGMVRQLLKACPKPDIIHAHSYGYYQVNASAMVRKLKNIPFVLTPHFHPKWSMWGGEKRKKVRAVYDRLIAQPVLDAVDILIGVSKHEMELLCEVLAIDQDKIRIVPNGIDFSLFDPIPSGEPFSARYLSTIDNEANIILYTGRLASNKGLETLVRAAPKILARFPNTFFLLVGEDEGMLDVLESSGKKLGVWEQFIVTGHIVDYAHFLSSYSACDVFVLPSEYEAFGIVLLEAMACEKPCVGTRVGGVPEVIEEGTTGLIVEYEDADALAEAIVTLLADKDKRRAMGIAGRKRVQQNFTWPKIVDQLEEIYTGLVE